MSPRPRSLRPDDALHSSELPFPLLLSALAVLVLACYAPGLGAPFVWDDHELIEGVRALARAPWWSPLSQPFWSGNALSSAAYFRPLAVLSFRSDAWLYADNAVGFHLTNLMVHTGNAILLALLARQRGARALGACAAALGFAWAPRLTESVTWVSGRTDVLATFFVLLAFLLWPLRRIGPVLAALAIGLGMLSKEVALAGALALFLLEWRAGNALPTRARRLAPLVVAVTCVLLWRALVLANAPAVNDGLTFQARLLSATEALGDYLGMLVDPWQPSLQIGWLGSPRAAAIGLGVAALLLLALGAFKLRRLRPSPYQFALLTLGATALVAVLHLAPLPIQVVAADRFLYLPIAALSLGLATLNIQRGRQPARAVIALALASLGAATWLRIDDWSDEARLWARATQSAHPNNPVPLLELGNLNYRVVRLRAAAHYYALAAAKPGSRATHDAIIANAANVSSLLGEHERALRELEALLERRPDVPEYRLDLVVAAIQAQQLDLAAVMLARVGDATRAAELGALLAQLRAGLPAFQAAQGVDLPALLVRARFFTRAGDRAAALAEWRRVVLAPAATQADVHEALRYFVVNGELSDVPNAAQRLSALGGVVEPELVQAFEFRQKQWRALETI